MERQSLIYSLVSAPRYQSYMKEADGDEARALQIYLWANELAGELHSTLSFVEVALRNAINVCIQTHITDGDVHNWTLEGNVPDSIFQLIGSKRLKFARLSAQRSASHRPTEHPRFREQINHDDVIAQLMFGTWVNLVYADRGNNTLQQTLWIEVLHKAFPGVSAGDSEREKLGRQLERVRRLRNRVAHHDNLLHVQVSHRLNDMLAILRAINKDFPGLVMSRNRLRSVLADDPRKKRF